MDDRQLMEEDALETEEEQHEKMPEIFRGTQMTRDAKAVPGLESQDFWNRGIGMALYRLGMTRLKMICQM